MLKKLINKSVHLIQLKSIIISSFETVTAEITEKEIERFKQFLEILNPGEELKPKEKVNIFEEKKGVMNQVIINDYMSRSTRTVLNSLEEDKAHFSKGDISLLHTYEVRNKNRQDVIDKIKQIGVNK